LKSFSVKQIILTFTNDLPLEKTEKPKSEKSNYSRGEVGQFQEKPKRLGGDNNTKRPFF